MIKYSKSAGAHAVTQALSLELDLRSLGERTAAAAAARHARTQLRRLQRMQAGAHASASAAPAAPQAEAEAVSSKRKRGGQGVEKNVVPVAGTKARRQVTQLPRAQHTASAAKQNGRTQSTRQAAHVKISQSSCKQQAT
jgi:hypothetical protein